VAGSPETDQAGSVHLVCRSAFLSMSYSRLGDSDRALESLTEVRRLMAKESVSQAKELRAIVAEAESVFGQMEAAPQQ